MNKKLPILIFFIFTSLGVTAQDSGKFSIAGKLIDGESGQPLEFATVSVLSATDSSLVDGAVTNPMGEFVINPNPGKYVLKMEFISYQVKYIDDVVLTPENPSFNIGEVQLNADTETLDEVVVQGARDQMQLKLDKRIFNTSENINNIGANATEVLDNIPSVAVDVEGNVSLRGSSNVRILINGKPSGLVGINDQDGLRQLQGDIIERVEVITNPSARYDAEGTGGIINIILKKDSQTGFNGSFTANMGYPANYGFSGNANYRTGKFNVFGSYGINYRSSPGGGYTDRVSFGDDTVYTYIDNERERSGLSHNFRVGTDYYINDNNILTFSGVMRISDEENITDLNYLDRDANQNIIGNSLRKDTETEDDNNLEYQVNYQRIMEGEGHELTAQFQYRDNDETEDSSIGEADLLAGESLSPYQRSLNEQVDKNMLMQVDYVYPFKEGKKIEAGYRGTIREISSDYEVEERDEDGNFVPIEEIFEDFNFSNKFIYNEDVHAAYAIFENDMEKWGYQLGLRVEQTFIETYQEVGDANDTKDYFNAFPSTFLSYKLDESKTLQASYSRRLSRPRFWYLNPFSSFSDPRNIRTGNTDLDPEYTDSYEIGMLNNLKKTTVYVGGYYRYTTGKIERISIPGEFAGNPATISTPYNIGIEDAYGIEANFSTDPAEWLNINGNGNFYRQLIDGSFSSMNEEGEIVIQDLSSDAITANFRLNARLKIGKINSQVSANYRAPENNVQGERKGIYSMDLGANTDVLKGKGTLSLSVRDLFNSRKYRGTLETENLIEDREFQWRSRQARLSFTYRINQNKSRKDRNDDRDGDFDGGGDGEDF